MFNCAIAGVNVQSGRLMSGYLQSLPDSMQQKAMSSVNARSRQEHMLK